jgi:hypothetical protein
MQTYACRLPALFLASRGGPGRHRMGSLLALGALFLAVLFLLSAVPFAAPVAAAVPASGVTTSAFGNCNVVGTKTPSALLQGIAVPSKNLTAGGNLSADMEVAAVNWTPAVSNITIHFPSVFFNFPLASGGKAQLFLSNRSFTMNFTGWSAPSLGQTKNYNYPAGLAFKAHAKAVIDSMKLAVVANADYGQITIEVRWQWIYQPHTGVTVHGPWSVPTTAANWPSSVPSIFYPAPYTTLLGTSGINGTIGTNWTATLGGDVAARGFFLEMEDVSGTVVQDLLQSAPPNVTTYSVHIPLLNYNNQLPPAPYLVHIHDACGAMLYSKTVHAVFASSASIRFFLTPSACAGRSIVFGGSSFANGSIGTFAPSSAAYTFSIPYCAGYHFHGWSTTGALHIATGHTMDVSYNGTFTVNYA